MQIYYIRFETIKEVEANSEEEALVKAEVELSDDIDTLSLQQTFRAYNDETGKYFY